MQGELKKRNSKSQSVMQIEKLKEIFSEDEVNKAIELLKGLDSNEAIEAVVQLSEGNLSWLKIYIKFAKKNKSQIIRSYKLRKKELETENDIWISKNEKIKWINFDAEKETVKSIDSEIESVENLFKSLETSCEALCCGIKAFSFSGDNITAKFKELEEKEKIVKDLNKLIAKVSMIEEEIILSTVLNQLFHKSVFMQLLLHLKSKIPST